MALALVWVCVSNMHSIISVGWIGAKSNFGGSQLRVSCDIFPVLDLRICTWVTYSPQDSVQRLLLAPAEELPIKKHVSFIQNEVSEVFLFQPVSEKYHQDCFYFDGDYDKFLFDYQKEQFLKSAFGWVPGGVKKLFKNKSRKQTE
jgi:hypothetical protein